MIAQIQVGTELEIWDWLKCSYIKKFRAVDLLSSNFMILLQTSKKIRFPYLSHMWNSLKREIKAVSHKFVESVQGFSNLNKVEELILLQEQKFKLVSEAFEIMGANSCICQYPLGFLFLAYRASFHFFLLVYRLFISANSLKEILICMQGIQA